MKIQKTANKAVDGSYYLVVARQPRKWAPAPSLYVAVTWHTQSRVIHE